MSEVVQNASYPTVSPPRVSIVIPAYNAGRFLADTLASVNAQTFAHLECVVVDDGSSDDTANVARRWVEQDPRIRLMKQANGGVAHARNAGVSLISSNASYIVFMDADDVWENFAIERLVAALEGDPAAVAAHGLAECIDEQGSPIHAGWLSQIGRARLDPTGGVFRPYPEASPTVFRTTISATMYPPGLMMIRRGVFDQTGGFDVEIQPADDWDMVIRLSRFGHIHFINEVILHYRRHAGNSSSGLEIPKTCSRVYNKAFHSPDNTPEQRVNLRDSWKAKQRVLLGLRFSEGRAAIRQRNVAAAASTFARIPFIAYRYLRGYPK